MKRAFLRTAMPLLLVTLTLLAIVLSPSTNWANDGTGEVDDLDNDGVRDRVEADSEGGGATSPGEVEIRSGSYGQLIVRFRGQHPHGRFGYSVGVADDFNLDAERDVIIGAPMEGEGRVYVFHGPFDTGPLVLQPDSAGMTFISPNGMGPEADYHFGERVAPASDVDGDGVTDIRIRAWFMRGGVELSRTYILSGINGEPFLVIEGNDPFDPWYQVEGDLDGDGDVDAYDQAIVSDNFGLAGEPGTLGLSVGDANGDGVVNEADQGIVQANRGANLFFGIWLPCDGSPPPPGMLCIERCDGLEWLLAENADRECRPILCPMNCGCTYLLNPYHTSGDTPHHIPVDQPITINVFADLNSCADWSILQGQELVFALEEECCSLSFTPLGYGPVLIRVSYDCCQGGCSMDIPLLVTCSGLPDPAGDDDNDGLTNWQEACFLGTDPENYDTDGDGLPDDWELDNGLDPKDTDSDGDGIRDTDEDEDGDGLSTHDEYVYDTNPNVGDTDGDGVSDGDEIGQGSDPNDASDGGQAPDPDEIVHVNISIGDPSGSHSEHWELRVGGRHYKAPGFGEVTCWLGEVFRRGKTFEVQLVHLGSNLEPPDLDHIAWIECIDEVNRTIVYDPDGILTPLPTGLCSNQQEAYDPFRTESFPVTSFDDERAWLILPILDVVGSFEVDQQRAYVAAVCSDYDADEELLEAIQQAPMHFEVRRNGTVIQTIETSIEDGVASSGFDVDSAGGNTYQLELVYDGLGGEDSDCLSDTFQTLPGVPSAIDAVASHSSLPADGMAAIEMNAVVRDGLGNMVVDGTAVTWTIIEGVAAFADGGVSVQSATAAGGAEAIVQAPTVSGTSPLRIRIQAGPATHEIQVDTTPVAGTLSVVDSSLDIATGESTTVELTTDAVDGTPVFWTFSNGQTSTTESVVEAGKSSVPLSAVDIGNGPCRVGPCVVTATVGGKLAWTTVDFVDSRVFHLEIDRNVVCGDVVESGLAPVPYADVAPVPGHTPSIPVDTHWVPYYANATLTINGFPLNDYVVEFVNPADSTYLDLLGVSDGIVTTDSSGTATITVRSTGSFTGLAPIVVPIRVIETFTTAGGDAEERITYVTVTEHTFWTKTWDGIKSFFGADPETGWGVASNTAGGVLIVADVGSIVKNLWRMAGGSDEEVNWVEMALSGAGILTEFAVGVGEVPDVPISAVRSIVAMAGKNPFTEALIKLLARSIANGHDIVKLTKLVTRLASGAIDLHIAKLVFSSEDLLECAMRAVDDLAEGVADDLGDVFLQRVQLAATSPGIGTAAAQNLTKVLGAPNLNPSVVAAIKALPAAGAANAMTFLAKVMRYGVDPALVTKVLNSPHIFTPNYTPIHLIEDLAKVVPEAADDAGIRGYNTMLKRLGADHPNAVNTALGTKYELITARTLVDQGYNAPWYVERLARTAEGITDIDFIARSADGTSTLLVQAKMSAGAFDLTREQAWVAKAKAFAEEQGFLNPQIVYVTPNSSAVSETIKSFFEEAGVQLLPNVPMP